jgi:uncharacterized membrane protein
VAAADPGGRRPGRSENRKRTRRIAYGGLLTAMALLFLSLSAIAPTADLALMTMASLCIAIAVMETGTTGALTVYAAVSLLSWLWPGIAFSFPFVTGFGLFPLIKAFAEKRWPRLPATLFKLGVSSALIVLTGFVFLREAVRGLVDRYGLFILPGLLLGSLAIVLIYDYALSLLIVLYQRRRPSPPS